MIGPELERPQAGAGDDFSDAVSFDFCDGERDLFGFARLGYLPNSGKVSAIGLLFAGGRLVASAVEGGGERPLSSWDRAEAGGVRVETHTPLERWNVAFAAQDARFDLEVRAVSPPVDLTAAAGVAVARATGASHYEQLCELTGAVEVGGTSYPVECRGRRTHTWGAPAWSRIESSRSLYAAVGEDSVGVTVAAVRPRGASGHDADAVTGYLVDGRGEPRPLEEVLLSTTYDAEQRPRRAGLELYLPGEEYARRLSGESVCGSSIDLGETVFHISFFRWSLDGAPALGRYDAHVRKQR